MRKMLAVGGCVGASFCRLIDKKQRRCIPMLFESDSLNPSHVTRDMRLSVLAFKLDINSFPSSSCFPPPHPSLAQARFRFFLVFYSYRIAHLLLPLSFFTSFVLFQVMTDRSNHGPVRRLSPSVSIDRKPYSRTGLKGVLGTLDLNSGDTAVPTPSDSPYYPFHAEIPQLEAPTQRRTSAPDGPRDVSGFPTYDQYQRIEGEYLSSLSERKQPKALISQALFDKILAVLQNGSEDRASTAQFRFWVRKMFVLVYPQTSFNHSASGQSPEPVVLHDKRPVAIKEQIYEVLCYCHAVARHGGRDKTCATLRLNYSWVPKELTAKFVKACPTCTLKRSGNPDLLSQFGSSSSPYAPQPQPPPEPASLPVFPGGPNDPHPSGLSFVVGCEGGDDGGCGGGFGPSMFATPDLSVYPSPTLSAGSLGPATPSPYLSSGLFGYPSVFDPGHHHLGNLSPVTGWDTGTPVSAFSPCGLMYPDEFEQQQQHGAPVNAEEIPCTATRDVQLQLPGTHRGDRNNGGAGGDGGGGCPCSHCSADSIVGTTPCTVNIDPDLLMDGRYSPFAFAVGPTRTATADDADTNMENPSSGGGTGHHVFQQLGLALGTTSTHGLAASISGPQPPRQRRLQLLSESRPSNDASPTTTMAPATDACSGSLKFNRDRDTGDVPESCLSRLPAAAPGASSNSAPLPPHGDTSNPLINMLMFKFASPGVQVVAAAPSTPTTTSTASAAAGVLGMRMRIEVREKRSNIIIAFWA